VHRGDLAAICEVKEFHTRAKTERLMQNIGRAITLSEKEQFGAVREAISEAAAQLRPYRDRGEALAVVLANPHEADVSLEETEDMIAAMYGNPGFRIQFDDQQSVVEENLAFLRDGVLAAKHRYLSAAITMHYRTNAADFYEAWMQQRRPAWDDIEDNVRRAELVIEASNEGKREAEKISGDYFFVRVLSTISAVTGQAEPVPRDLFDDPRDEYWAMDRATGELERLP
jgi:hypothetical protein